MKKKGISHICVPCVKWVYFIVLLVEIMCHHTSEAAWRHLTKQTYIVTKRIDYGSLSSQNKTVSFWFCAEWQSTEPVLQWYRGGDGGLLPEPQICASLRTHTLLPRYQPCGQVGPLKVHWSPLKAVFLTFRINSQKPFFSSTTLRRAHFVLQWNKQSYPDFQKVKLNKTVDPTSPIMYPFLLSCRQQLNGLRIRRPISTETTVSITFNLNKKHKK